MAGLDAPWSPAEDEVRELGLVSFCDKANGIAGLLAPRFGGEMASLQVRWRDKWYEALYRAALYKTDPPYWRGRAPLLWPAVGRSFVDEEIRKAKETGEDPRVGSYRVGDAEYEIGTHGFAMDMPWRVEPLDGQPDGTVGLFTLQDTPETHARYPFAFKLTVAYTTGPWGIRATYTVEAGANDQPMPFAIGNHISMLTPAAGAGAFDGTRLLSPATGYRGLEHPSLFDGSVHSFDFTNVALADERVHNMVSCGFTWDRAHVTLWSPESFGFTITQRVLDSPGGVESLAPAETCFFVFWSEPSENYFCPEPWLGGPNALNTGDGLVRLDPGQRFLWQMEVKPVFAEPSPR
jgi:galactose mutarotase-like enzyme